MTASETRQVTVQIVSITFDTTIQGQAKKYPGTEVIYKTTDGKVQTKNIHTKNFGFNKTLRGDLEALTTGDFALITEAHEGDFWKWLTVVKTDGQAPAAAAPATSAPSGSVGGAAPAPTQTQVRSNYETPEERKLRRDADAARQVMIVRQSSITAALKLSELDGSEYSPDEAAIIASAKIFEAYVLGTEVAQEVATEAGGVNLPE